MYWLFELIYKHGDIERHPGPSIYLWERVEKRGKKKRNETYKRKKEEKKSRGGTKGERGLGRVLSPVKTYGKNGQKRSH